jgi:hypothetical protein
VKRVFSFLFALCVATAYAQVPCSDYPRLMQEAQKLIKEEKYLDALRKYNSAQAHCPEKRKEVEKSIENLFVKIENLRIEAQKAKENAEKAEKETAKALAEAEKQKQLAQTNLDKANKLVNAFYFYEGRFALAFKDNKFYFIDKNGDKVEKLGEWNKAEQFEWNGFSKVKKDEYGELFHYLLDTLGNSYRAAYTLKELSPDIKALDLTDTKLETFPDEILAHSQLEVLILNGEYNNNNNFKTLPAEIAKLPNLKVLQVEYCQMYSLPAQIGALKNLTTLDLSFNELRTLPAQIWELKNLTYLNLSYNPLSSLPAQIGELKNLTTLNLHWNQLSTLPAQIGELKNLRYLYLEENNFSKEEQERIRKLLPKCAVMF